MNNQKTVVFFVLTKKKQRNKKSARGLKAGSNDKTKDFIGPTSSLGRLAKREIKTPRKRIHAKFNTHGEIKITKENDFRVITKTFLVQYIYRSAPGFGKYQYGSRGGAWGSGTLDRKSVV